MVDLGGFGESAQAVAALFALPSDFRSIGLHVDDTSQRQPTTQVESQGQTTKLAGNRLLALQVKA